MRNKFFELLMKEMQQDEKIIILFADMGKGIYEKFKLQFPERILNIGISEQNLIGMAAGMCEIGYKPFCYTISNFLVERSYEQIRDDIIVPKNKVVLVGTSTGFDSGIEGVSHYSLEDIGVMKTLPNMEIYSPSTVTSIEACFKGIINSVNPCYIRIGKGSYNYNHDAECDYFTVKAKQKKVLIIAHGNILEYCNNLCSKLDYVSVLAMNRVVPLNLELIEKVFGTYENVLIVEEQLESCGLYNILCQEIISNKIKYNNIFNVKIDEYCSEIGTKQYFADRYGYSTEELEDFIVSLIN